MYVTASYFSQVHASPRHFLIETADETAVDEATSLNRRHEPINPECDEECSCEEYCYHQIHRVLQTHSQTDYDHCVEDCGNGEEMR